MSTPATATTSLNAAIQLAGAPAPKLAADQIRWMISGLRRRVLYGLWEEDLKLYVKAIVGDKRRKVWGAVDTACNLARAAGEAYAVTYHGAPSLVVDNRDLASDGELAFSRALEATWVQMRRVQRDMLVIRAMGVAVERVGNTIETRAVFPDNLSDVIVRKGRVVRLTETRFDSETETWLVEHFDIRDPKNVVHTLERHGRDNAKTDETPKGEGDKPAAYPWTDAGAPYIPYVLRTATLPGGSDPWEPTDWQELIDSTMSVATLCTFWRHGVYTSSWVQKVLVGGVPAGMADGDDDDDDGQPPQTIETDPATTLVVVPLEPATTAEAQAPVQVTQWAPAIEVAKLETAIGSYARRLSALMGLSPSDVTRVSGDPRSGYALEISREGQRQVQALLEPVERIHDRELLRIAAAVWNNAQDKAALRVQTTGWDLTYAPLPLSRTESEARLNRVEKLTELNLVDRIGAASIAYGVSREEAERLLVRMNLPTTAVKADADAGLG
jgi:hypothetical protein